MPDSDVAYAAQRMEWAMDESEYQYWLEVRNQAIAKVNARAAVQRFYD